MRAHLSFGNDGRARFRGLRSSSAVFANGLIILLPYWLKNNSRPIFRTAMLSVKIFAYISLIVEVLSYTNDN